MSGRTVKKILIVTFLSHCKNSYIKLTEQVFFNLPLKGQSGGIIGDLFVKSS